MCDTFVVLPPLTGDGSVLFGKNSDREPNEAQILEYRPAREYSPGRTVRCTYREIPQVRKTFSVLLCRPFWMWGAEMGANEKGVVMGNEAVWTRMPLQKDGVLTGMDLLRLALERSSSAEQALEVVTQLLSDYGQGGRCGYEDRRISYHNSYIIADSRGAWVLETAGPLWAALKVRGMYAISNGLTIGEECDKTHPDLITTARKEGWLKKGEDFHFARCFSDFFFTTFSASRRRRRRVLELLGGTRETPPKTAFEILRDHGESEYRPNGHLLGNRVCAHAGNLLFRNATQTVGSLVAHLQPDSQTYWATGTSSPCLSTFKPIWFRGSVLPDLKAAPRGTCDGDTLWWHHEKLHRTVLLDFPLREKAFRDERDDLEREFLAQAIGEGANACAGITASAFGRARNKTSEWTERVREMPVRKPPGVCFRRYWRRQNRKAGIMLQQ